MPKYDRRRVFKKTMYVLRQTGKPMRMYVRNVPVNAATPAVPSDLFTAAEEPLEVDSEFTVYGFFGKFEEEDIEIRGEGGRFKQVKGTVTVPFAYRSILAKADYIDPYMDGSRFQKVGPAVVDEERLLIYQPIGGTTFPSVDEITS